MPNITINIQRETIFQLIIKNYWPFLETFYLIVWLDAIHYEFSENG
ncbi:MAG: hypothetical protein OEM01_01435 [Desulfobulbaceae bacterium]|nr:hypothetical protein [Desulfobulbaceae bacterium]